MNNLSAACLEPYIGLKPFTEQEKDRFFGRARETSILLDKIRANRLTLLLAGIMPVRRADGQRRRQLEARFEAFIAQGFSGRILDFDEPAARSYAKLMGIRRKKGCPMSLPDGQIAAVAHVSRLALATRNMRDFIACGIELINPFEQTAASP